MPNNIYIGMEMNPKVCKYKDMKKQSIQSSFIIEYSANLEHFIF